MSGKLRVCTSVSLFQNIIDWEKEMMTIATPKEGPADNSLVLEAAPKIKQFLS